MQELVDITPHPRILRVLADIPFSPWQCIAELVDNALDAFRDEKALDIEDKRIIVSWSSDSVAAAQRQLEVIDTGPGIDLATIQNSVRAGYTSKSTTSSLGLFGMGFNIATARLGEKITFISATKDSPDWVGIELDISKLILSGKFEAPVVKIKKVKSDDHGSKVIVSRLKPTIFGELRKSANAIRRILSDIYAPALNQHNVEIRIQSKIVIPFKHCIWGENRYVTRKQETIHAVVRIDEELGEGFFDQERNRYLTAEEDDDVRQKLNEQGKLPQGIITRVKRIHGWLGIQRYPDPNDFGIDFIRNGRKILRRDRTLFYYNDEILGASTLEYPVELSGTVGGRIVGELHVDYLPPNYQKNDFDRTDPTWYETIEFLKGTGPLLPAKRKLLGYDAENDSPIGRLVKGYGECRAGTHYLAAPNKVAREYAEKFRQGDPEYITDDKWWEAARDADRSRGDKNASKSPVVDSGRKSSDSVADYAPQVGSSRTTTVTIESPNGKTVSPITTSNTTANSTLISPASNSSANHLKIGSKPFASSSASTSITTSVEPTKKVDPIDELKSRSHKILTDSHNYSYPGCLAPIHIDVWDVTTGKIEGDSDLPCLIASHTNRCDFFFNSRHAFLRTYPTSYKDLLLMQLAQKFKSRDLLQSELPIIFTQLVTENFPELRVDQVTIEESAKNFFEKLREKAPELLSLREQEVLDRIHESAGEVEDIASSLIYNSDLLSKFQTRQFGGIQALTVAPPRTLVRLIDEFPEEFFDGKFFRMPYMSISLPDPKATERLRNEAKERLLSFVKDALWVISETRPAPYPQRKAELARCSLSLNFLDQEIEK